MQANSPIQTGIVSLGAFLSLKFIVVGAVVLAAANPIGFAGLAAGLLAGASTVAIIFALAKLGWIS